MADQGYVRASRRSPHLSRAPGRPRSVLHIVVTMAANHQPGSRSPREGLGEPALAAFPVQ